MPYRRLFLHEQKDFEAAKKIASAHTLVLLRVSVLGVTPPILQAITAWTSLRAVKFHCICSDDVLRVLGSLQKLEEAVLTNMRAVTNEGILLLTAATSVRVLSLQEQRHGRLRGNSGSLVGCHGSTNYGCTA